MTQTVHSIMINGEYIHAVIPNHVRRSGNQKPRNGGGAYSANYTLANSAGSVRVYTVRDAIDFYDANASNPDFQRSDIDALDPDGRVLPFAVDEEVPE